MASRQVTQCWTFHSTDNADAVKTWAVAAQMLLLCCWRSHREVSLCFGDVSAHLEKVIALEILPENEFVKMGVYFMDGTEFESVDQPEMSAEV